MYLSYFNVNMYALTFVFWQVYITSRQTNQNETFPINTCDFDPDSKITANFVLPLKELQQISNSTSRFPVVVFETKQQACGLLFPIPYFRLQRLLWYQYTRESGKLGVAEKSLLAQNYAKHLRTNMHSSLSCWSRCTINSSQTQGAN